ncbi:optic atrophy 3 protein-like [Acomys russatus]|uniref:optic atrophy 3 protein-like n=1 Tax=Acomys russatus TaxID=60746 RepID=UPI0021E228AF|nr:optic atrophy 3 protein-like [Acomys russatus]
MRTKMRIMGFHAEAIKPLNEEAAAELGANLLGEAIIFACAGSCLLMEFWRQQSVKHRKEVQHVASLQSLREDVDRLEQALDELQLQVQETLPRSALDQLRAELLATLQEFKTQICEPEADPEASEE